MTPQETEADLPVNVWEALEKAWVHNGPAAGSGHWQLRSWESRSAGPSPLGGDHHHSWTGP